MLHIAHKRGLVVGEGERGARFSHASLSGCKLGSACLSCFDVSICGLSPGGAILGQSLPGICCDAAGFEIPLAGILEPRLVRVLILAAANSGWVPGLRRTPSMAHAIIVSTGLGPFYDGLSHFALTPEDLLPALALALLVGLSGARAGRTNHACRHRARSGNAPPIRTAAAA